MIYIRDGVRCYLSETLRRELYITDGQLMKEPKKRAILFGYKYYTTFCAIDFRKRLIRFKNSGKKSESSYGFDSKKDIPFSSILEVKNLEMDAFSGEHKNVIDLPFRGKF